MFFRAMQWVNTYRGALKAWRFWSSSNPLFCYVEADWDVLTLTKKQKTILINSEVMLPLEMIEKSHVFSSLCGF